MKVISSIVHDHEDRINTIVDQSLSMQPEEFCRCIDISDLILPKQGVVVIWKWCWTKDEPSKEEHCDSVICESKDSSDEATEADKRSHTIVYSSALVLQRAEIIKPC